MSQPCLLIVEADILVRHPLAEYLRECGYRVLEAFGADEARRLLGDGTAAIDIVLADVDAPGESGAPGDSGTPGESGFALAAWIRANHPGVEVVLAGSVARAAEKAGDLCQEGPALRKPYDHRLVLNEIRRSLAACDRNKATE